MATAAEEIPAPALAETVRVDGAPAEATLAGGELRWRSASGERLLALEAEALGIDGEGARFTVRAFVGETKPKGAPRGGEGKAAIRRGRRDFVFEMQSEATASRWRETLQDRLNSLGRPKSLFVIVNPFGGKRWALKVFQNEVKPLLEAANILYTMQETKYRLHAKEIAHSLDLGKYDGIVCVSGDGVLVEVVNGLLQREDWDMAIKMPLGIIPAGSGNGMAKSLSHSVGSYYSAAESVFAVIRGHKRMLDVASVVQGKARFFSILMLTWGLVADVDIESEKYRWMGSARFDFYSLLRLVNLRKYNGCVQFVPAPGYEEYGEPIKQSERSKYPGDSPLSEKDAKNSTNSQLCSYPGPLIKFEEAEWRSLPGPFVLVWVNNVPWPGEEVMAAPDAKFSDGYLDVMIVKDCPRSAILGLMTKANDGGHPKSPYVTCLKVKAFQLEPGQRVGSRAKGGIVDSDGEVIARGDGSPDSEQQEHLMAYGPPIQMTVDQGLATIFTPI